MFNFILTTEETTEDNLKIIGYAWLPMVTSRHFCASQIF